MNLFVYFACCICYLLGFFASLNYAAHRNLSYFVNPGCNLSACQPGGQDKIRLNVVHIKATGENNTIHYLWSTYKVPTVIIAGTSRDASLHIDWEKLLQFQEQAILFSEEPLSSVSFIIRELWEFNDVDDNVDMGHSPNISSLGISDLFWDDINDTLHFTEKFISALPESRNNESVFSNNGAFKVQFSISAEDMPSNEYPHLWFTSTSSEMKLLLSGLQSTYKNSRFAAEVVGISSGVQKTLWEDQMSVSFDDEYSPGVFKVNSLYLQCLNSSSDCSKGFVLWKPVAYIGEKPTVANSSDASASVYVKEGFGISDSIAASYFGDGANVSMVTWNITFGTNGDGFYKKTKYTAWSVMVGVGDPIMDKISVLATAVISVGLGAPLLIILGGATFLGYKKCWPKDDDLLLEG